MSEFNQHITYLSEPVEDYQALLDACHSLDELRTFLSDWKLLANDAYLAALQMSEKDWPFFRKGLKSERRGRYAGDEWATLFGLILMPTVLFNVSLTASKYCCPWGLAYSRHKEAGHLVEEDGIAVWRKQP